MYLDLETALNYTFIDKSIIDLALCHTSYANEHQDTPMDNNERLEFLGDAVLNLIVGDLLMKHFPDVREGDLSRMRASLVSESGLAQIARTIHLGPIIKLGKGEDLNNGREKNSILSDVFEAVMASIYKDGGFDSAYNVIESLFTPRLEAPEKFPLNTDHKTQLQEISQSRFKEIPSYKVIHEEGPDHNKTFKICLTLNHHNFYGTGKSKKAAEQKAAGKALEALKEENE